MSAVSTDVVPSNQESTGMVAMMERLALNPDLPVDKLEKLLDMQIRVRAIEAEQSYSAAMAKVQSKLTTVARTKDNDQTNSKYAPLEKIVEAAAPIYTGEGFSISFSEAASPKENHVRVVGILRHAHGHSTEHYRDVAIDKTGIAGKVNKTDTHAEASSITYGRRYVVCLAFNIPTGDDTDGNKSAAKGETISDKQVADIEALITEVSADRERFLKWAGVESIDRITTKRYPTCIKQLEAKRSK